MSTISSTSLDPQALLLQRLQRAQPDPTDTARRQADFEAAATDAGADPTKLAELEQQIQQAIQTAQQNGDTSTDQRAAIQEAVRNVLQQNGVDPAKFEEAMKSQQAGKHRHHRHAGQPQASAPASEAVSAQAQTAETTATATPSAAPATGLDVSV